MYPQNQREKKRIARIGQTAGEYENGDFMSEIIENMERHSTTFNVLKKAQASTSYQAVNNADHSTAGSSNTPMQYKATMPPKKYLPEKKYPLMEKCHRNLKYIKHNRSIPKQRAHINTIPGSTKLPAKKVASREKEENSKPKSGRKTCSPTNDIVNVENDSSSDISDFHENSSKSDSDSNFEKFISEHKDTILSDEANDSESSFKESRSKKLKKHRKKQKIKKQENTSKKEFVKNKSPELKTGNSYPVKSKALQTNVSDLDNTSDSEDLESSLSSENQNQEKYRTKKVKKKRKAIDFSGVFQPSKKVTSTIESSKLQDALTKRKLNESDVSDDDSDVSMRYKKVCNRELSDSSLSYQNSLPDNHSTSLSETEKKLPRDTFDLTEPRTENYIGEQFKCTVRIKRDPTLDEKMVSYVPANKNTDDSISVVELPSAKSFKSQNISYESSVPLNNTSEKCIDSTESDDDCQIICVIPKISVNGNAIKANEKINANSCSSACSPGLFPLQDVINKNLDGTANNAAIENAECNIKIATVQSLKKSDHLIPSMNASKSNGINDMNIAILENSGALNESEIYVPKDDSVKQQSVKDNVMVGGTVAQEQILIPNLDELLSKIDFNLIKHISIQNECEDTVNRLDNISDMTTNNKGENIANFAANVNLLSTEQIRQTSQSQNVLPNDGNKDESCVNSNIRESSNKIDFKEILEITSSESKKSYVEKENCANENYLIEKSETIPVLSSDHKILQNLKEFDRNGAPSDSCSTSKATLTIDSSNSNNEVLCEINTNSVKLGHFGSKGKHSLNDRNSDQSTNISNLSMSNHCNETFYNDSETLNIGSQKPELKESPSDELDTIAATSIRELCEDNKSVEPLYILYLNKLKQFEEIVSTEQNVSTGLRMLQEKKAKEIKCIEASILNLVQHDPCFHKMKEKFYENKRSIIDKKMHIDVENAQDIFNEDVRQSPTQCDIAKVKQDDENSLQRIHLWKLSLKCSNCGKEAKFQCQGCKNAFFCSSECGISFWEKEHSVTCPG